VLPKENALRLQYVT